MKKTFLVYTAVCLLLLAGHANAYQLLTDFTVNFKAIDANFSTHTNINFFSYDATTALNTEIIQYLGIDNKVGNGDTFTESGFMTLGSVSPSSITNPIDTFDDDGSLEGGGAKPYVINLWYQGLTGTISNYNNNGTLLDTADDSWDYVFDNGVGSIGWYLDDDFDPTNGVVGSALLTGHVVPVSSGTADGFLSGLGTSSNWDVTAEVDSLMAGLLLDKDGNDLLTKLVNDDYLITITTGDTTINTLISQDASGNPLFDTNKNEAYLIFKGFTGDNTHLGVVPEPATMLLFGIGLLGLAGITRRKNA